MSLKLKSEDKWQAEDDARTLMRASEIHGDKKRHGKAVKHLGKMADDAQRAVATAKASGGLKAAFPKDE